MRRSKLLLIIIILSILSNQTSCNYRDIEEMPMVVGIGVDPSEEGYRLTAKIIIPVGGSEGGSQSEQIFIQTTGRTMFEAARDFILKEGKKIFWGQLQIVVIHQDIAKEDLSNVLDFFTRDDEIREDIQLLICGKDYTAEEIMFASVSEKRLEFHILAALENVDPISKYDPITMADFNDIYTDKGSEALIPLINIEESLGAKRVIMFGGGVLKDNRLIGELDGKQVQLYRIVVGRSGIGILIINYKDENEETNVSYSVSSSKSKIKMEYVDQMCIIHVDVSMTGTIGEIMNNQAGILSMEDRDEFIKQAQEQMKKEIGNFIIHIQKEFGSDIFGFGEKFKKKYPSIFKAFGDDWNNVFEASNVHVAVKISLNGSGLIRQPLKEGN